MSRPKGFFILSRAIRLIFPCLISVTVFIFPPFAEGKTIYQWVDENGTVNLTEFPADIPEKYRNQIFNSQLPSIEENQNPAYKGQPIPLENGIGILRLWGNMSFLRKKESTRFLKEWGEPQISPYMTGMVMDSSINWIGIIYYIPAGHVRDIESEENDLEFLLKTYEKEFNNSKMIFLWYTRPLYDKKNHTLTYSILGGIPGEFWIDHWTYILGRTAVFVIRLVIPNKNSEIALDLIKHFSFAISFAPGNDYSSYKTGDRISPINLPELIAIGLGNENSSLNTNSQTKKTERKIVSSKKQKIETSFKKDKYSTTGFYLFRFLVLLPIFFVLLKKLGRLFVYLADLVFGWYGLYKARIQENQERSRNLSNEELKDPYAILGVHRTDSLEKIKEVYRNLVKTYHPDKHPDVDDNSKKQKSDLLAKINESYNWILKHHVAE